jgi:hypothetical protein
MTSQPYSEATIQRVDTIFDVPRTLDETTNLSIKIHIYSRMNILGNTQLLSPRRLGSRTVL